MADTDYFALKTKVHGGSMRYIDVANSSASEGVEMTVYGSFHGGANQQWTWDHGRIVTHLHSPTFGLAVKEIKDGSHIILHSRNAGGNFSDTWILENGVIKAGSHQDYYIGLSGNKLVLRSTNSHPEVIKWETQTIIPPKPTYPATSSYLHYKHVPMEKLQDAWTLENTVCVRKTADCTYFCMIGWPPGGYSGIQQIDEHNRVAIFSFWNDGAHSVTEVDHGDGVHVTTFGGEGTGMKSMKRISWELNQKVTFRVSGEKRTESSGSFWRCSCWYKIEDEDWNFMASFDRAGHQPFTGDFYSFIEDWRRDKVHQGHLQQRLGEYSQQTVITKHGEVVQLKEAVESKVMSGADKFASNKVFGAVRKSLDCFVLTTGGPSEDEIRAALVAEGCEQVTNRNWTKLTL